MADALSINIASISIVFTQSGSNVVVKYIIIGSYQITITVVERLQINILAVDGLNQLFTFETSKKKNLKKQQQKIVFLSSEQDYIAAAAVTNFHEFSKQI